jgi:hypothetical protein
MKATSSVASIPIDAMAKHAKRAATRGHIFAPEWA